MKRLSLIFLMLILSLAACSTKPEPEPVAITIGLITDLSGERAESDGRPTTEAARLAVEEINSGGGLVIDGRSHPVRLIIRDNENTPAAAVAAAQELINQENIVALIGPQSSRLAIPVAEVAEAASVPMISPTSTNPQVTAGKSFAFRVAFIDPFQGAVMADFAHRELALQTAAVLYDITDEYSRDLAEIFRRAFEDAGGQIVAFESYTADINDFFDPLTGIRASEPQALFLPNFPHDVSRQAEQIRWLGSEAALLGSDSWSSATLFQQPELDGAFVSGHWHPAVGSAVSDAFIAAYRTAYDTEPTDTAALTYDAVNLLFAAIRQQGESSTTAIQQGLYSLPPFPGVSGSIDFQDNGDPVKSVVIMQIQNQQLLFYKTIDP